MKTAIPEKFKERYEELVDDREQFFSCLNQQPPKSFRVNTLKASANAVVERFRKYEILIKQTPWYSDAFVSGNPEIGSTMEHFAGWIYVQELASMLPPLVVREELRNANLVLDACAAPGSKTTQLAALMENRGTIIANDINYGRLRALKFNIEKTGCLNTVMTNHDMRFFPQMQAGVVLLDAPCSAEGTVRKNLKVFSAWSEKRIFGYSSLQKHLILRAFDLLAPGGVLVYSTCTFAPEENEIVVDSLLEKRPAKLERIKIHGMKTSEGITEWSKERLSNELSKAARIWPHHNDTDGFFIAKVRK